MFPIHISLIDSEDLQTNTTQNEHFQSVVNRALNRREFLNAQSITVCVVSMPLTQVINRQDAKYKTSVLPQCLPRVAIEWV